MKQTNINTIINQEISSLFDEIEEKDTSQVLDLELINGIVTVDLPNGRQYLINKHEPTGQIWVSSPLSGGHHFAFKEGKFYCTKTQKELRTMLFEEISQYL